MPSQLTTADARAIAFESAPTATVLYPVPALLASGGTLTLRSSSPSPTAVAKYPWKNSLAGTSRLPLRDSITMLRGPAGSGKTTLAGMYARAGARRGERVAYYGFEETRSMLLRNFASIGLPEDEAGILLGKEALRNSDVQITGRDDQ